VAGGHVRRKEEEKCYHHNIIISSYLALRKRVSKRQSETSSRSFEEDSRYLAGRSDLANIRSARRKNSGMTRGEESFFNGENDRLGALYWLGDGEGGSPRSKLEKNRGSEVLLGAGFLNLTDRCKRTRGTRGLWARSKRRIFRRGGAGSAS